MQKLQFVRSRCVVRNISKRSVKLLGRATLPPTGDAIDLFEVIPNLSEILIVDALRQPSGEFFLRQADGQIEMIECDLVIFNNAVVPPPIVNIQGITTIDADAPLTFSDGKLKISKANEYNDGFLSKSDFVDMKRQSFKVTVWQYQDFKSVDGITVNLSQFNSFDFDSSAIVNGSAFVVNASNEAEPIYKPGTINKLFKKNIIEVQSHVKETVVLESEIPKGEVARVYFLVSALPNDITGDKVLPVAPEVVRNARIEVVAANTVEGGKSSVIAGEKRFVNKTVFTSVGVGGEPQGATLNVHGSTKTRELAVTKGARAGHVMTSNSLGDAEWMPLPIISAIPPSLTTPGTLWYKTTEAELFYLQSDANKWLSVDSESILFKSSATHVTNAYLDIVDNGYAQAPSVIRSKSFMITDIEFDVEKSSPIALELHSDSGPILDAKFEMTEGGRRSISGLSVVINAGIPLRVFINGSNALKPKVKIKIKTIG